MGNKSLVSFLFPLQLVICLTDLTDTPLPSLQKVSLFHRHKSQPSYFLVREELSFIEFPICIQHCIALGDSRSLSFLILITVLWGYHFPDFLKKRMAKGNEITQAHTDWNSWWVFTSQIPSPSTYKMLRTQRKTWLSGALKKEVLIVLGKEKNSISPTLSFQ